MPEKKKEPTYHHHLKEISNAVRETNKSSSWPLIISWLALAISIISLVVVAKPDSPNVLFSGVEHIRGYCPDLLTFPNATSITFYFTNIGKVPTQMWYRVKGENIVLIRKGETVDYRHINPGDSGWMTVILPYDSSNALHVTHEIYIYNESHPTANLEFSYEFKSYIFDIIPVFSKRKSTIAKCDYKLGDDVNNQSLWIIT